MANRPAKEKSPYLLQHKENPVDWYPCLMTAPSSELEALLGVKGSRLRELLGSMVKEELIVAEGGNKNRRYRLKS